jgi:tRNA(Ile)-lysidine synthase TilS/MesJ
MSDAQMRCARCVLSSNFPRISFDEHGVCNFCREKIVPGTADTVIDEARISVKTHIDSVKGKSEYDAIVCYSGGKDSTYTLMRAVRTYGLKVLAFTLDNGFMSPDAFVNIRRVVDVLGVDHVTVRPAVTHMRAIIAASATKEIYNKKTLTRISSGCNSCISIVNMTALKLAIEKQAPLIIAGFTLGQIPVNSIMFQNNYAFLEESRVSSLALLRKEAGDFVDDYFRIRPGVLKGVINYPHTLNLLCLENITENEILAAIAPLGWIAPKDVDGCSSNCRLNVYNNYVHQKRFGYSPYELELSHLVRKGLLSREEAIAKLEDQPREHLRKIMEELGVVDNDV